MRYRNDVTPQAPGRHRLAVNGVTVVDEELSKPVSVSRQIYDEVIPNYHSRSAAGEIFNNPYSSSKATYQCEGSYSGSSTSGSSSLTNSYTGGVLLALVIPSTAWPDPAFPQSIEALRSESMIETQGRVNATEFDAGTFAGEWKKTRVIHREVGQAFVKMFGALTGKKSTTYQRDKFSKVPLFDASGRPILGKKGQPMYRYSHEGSKFKGSNPKTADLSGAYLLGRYGVAPLLHDLEDAVKFLKSNKSSRQTARSTKMTQAVGHSTYTVPDAHGAWTVALTTTKTYAVRTGILYDTSPAMRAVAQLGMTRPLSTLWELAPWSFAIDHWVNVGQWLDAVQPDGASNRLAAWVSSSFMTVNSASVSSSLNWANETDHFSASWNEGLIKVVHDKYRELWNPVLPTRPAFGSGFTPLRSLDYVALVLQQISGRRS